uniref:Uncharacterized protein n=1 Tax=Anguilla anguilla TaxID=7936 RepID=A0A0E9UP98_ANGAN
MEPQAESSQCQ